MTVSFFVQKYSRYFMTFYSCLYTCQKSFRRSLSFFPHFLRFRVQWLSLVGRSRCWWLIFPLSNSFPLLFLSVVWALLLTTTNFVFDITLFSRIVSLSFYIFFFQSWLLLTLQTGEWVGITPGLPFTGLALVEILAKLFAFQVVQDLGLKGLFHSEMKNKAVKYLNQRSIYTISTTYFIPFSAFML